MFDAPYKVRCIIESTDFLKLQKPLKKKSGLAHQQKLGQETWVECKYAICPPYAQNSTTTLVVFCVL